MANVSACPTIQTAYLALVMATFKRCHSLKKPMPVGQLRVVSEGDVDRLSSDAHVCRHPKVTV